MNANSRGCTFLELLVVVTVICLIAFIVTRFLPETKPSEQQVAAACTEIINEISRIDNGLEEAIDALEKAHKVDNDQGIWAAAGAVNNFAVHRADLSWRSILPIQHGPCVPLAKSESVLATPTLGMFGRGGRTFNVAPALANREVAETIIRLLRRDVLEPDKEELFRHGTTTND